MNPVNGFSSEHGAFLQNFDFYMGLFTQKPSVFRADFSHISRRAAICRPPERASVPLEIFAFTRNIIAALPRANG